MSEHQREQRRLVIESAGARLAIDFAFSYIGTELMKLPPEHRRRAQHKAVAAALNEVTASLDKLRRALPSDDLPAELRAIERGERGAEHVDARTPRPRQ